MIWAATSSISFLTEFLGFPALNFSAAALDDNLSSIPKVGILKLGMEGCYSRIIKVQALSASCRLGQRSAALVNTGFVSSVCIAFTKCNTELCLHAGDHPKVFHIVRAPRWFKAC